jgi:hypothetical protein
VAKLNIEIQKGLLVLALLEVNGEQMVVFCKADDTECAAETNHFSE